jgi:hypothetical protein
MNIFEIDNIVGDESLCNKCPTPDGDCDDCIHLRIAQRQAEISSRDGAKKVVEYLYKEFAYFMPDEPKELAKIIIDDYGYYGRKGSIKQWQDKLKEWGIS